MDGFVNFLCLFLEQTNSENALPEQLSGDKQEDRREFMAGIGGAVSKIVLRNMKFEVERKKLRLKNKGSLLLPFLHKPLFL